MTTVSNTQVVLEKTASEEGGELGGLSEAYLTTVREILEAGARGSSWCMQDTVRSLAKLATVATGAEVGYVRRTVGHDSLELFGADGGVEWRVPERDRWGTIPRKKHFKDCFNGDGASQFALGTLSSTSCHSRKFQDEPWIGQYTDDENRYLRGLGSVAVARLGLPTEGPPRFLLFLGHRNATFLTDGSSPHRQLKNLQPLLDAAFRLAEGVQDRFDKAQRLKNLTEALPPLALAPTGKAFWRGVATILTAEKGFRFDRAMVFLWRGGEDVAECRMAVGGMGDQWGDERKTVAEAFKDCTLLDYVQDALEFPEPGSGSCKLADPLYREICKQRPLVFDRRVSTGIARWLESVENEARPGLEAQPAARLTCDEDQWIKMTAEQRPGVFFGVPPTTWPVDEYFAFPLVALDAKGKRRHIGFVLADVCYAPGGHVPGMDMPDLEITATVLHLIAGMWLARQQEEAYINTLGAMHAVRHHGGKVSLSLDILTSLLPDGVKSDPQVDERLRDLRNSGTELGKARRIIEGIEDQRLNAGPPTDPGKIMAEAAQAAEGAYPHLKFTLMGDPAALPDFPLDAWTGEFARIPGESLRQILDCILDNAAEFGKIEKDGEIRAVAKGAIRVINVDEEGEPAPGKRIFLTLENDGLPVSPGLAPFLFVDGVSTRTTKGHGTGLSTARQIAKAYRGDVMLLNHREPVRFGIVLPIAGSPPPEKSA